jgi:cupin superfamily acireductone dioxygenase involved in methionine salvage
MAKHGFEKIESNEVIQSLYKYTVKKKSLSLLNKYHKNKIMMQAFDRLHTQQIAIKNQKHNRNDLKSSYKLKNSCDKIIMQYKGKKYKGKIKKFFHLHYYKNLIAKFLINIFYSIN